MAAVPTVQQVIAAAEEPMKNGRVFFQGQFVWLQSRRRMFLVGLVGPGPGVLQRVFLRFVDLEQEFV